MAPEWVSVQAANPSTEGVILDWHNISSEPRPMYILIGADQKEYGPVAVEEIRAWIKEGRANGQTLARLEGGQIGRAHV